MEKNKIILDFDGIFASDMMYTQEGKAMKTFPWGIRHSVDLLVKNGFEIYIITGDSTEFGKNISKKFIHNLKINDIFFVKSHDKLKFLRKKFNLDEVIYSGDDIYDIEIFKECYAISTKDTHTILKLHADYISKYSTRDYYFMDMAIHILSKFRNTGEDLSSLSEHLVGESSHEPMNKLLQDKRYKRILILQQYSMRNHTDNKYNLLLDGNLNLTLHRLYNALSSDSEKKVTITMPDNYDESQFLLLELFVIKAFGENRIKFMPIKYGLNALENRKTFSDFEFDEKDFDLFICDFSNVNVTKTLTIPVVHNMNISKVPELDRWFVDEFFEEQTEMTKSFNTKYTYVLNQNQKNHLVRSQESSREKNIMRSKVIVENEVINEILFSKQLNFFINLLSESAKNEINATVKKYKDHTKLFLPFRLSDQCYNFYGITKTLGKQNENFVVFVTNPNSAKISVTQENITIVDLSIDGTNKKSLYYYVLSLCESENIFIPIFENPEQVLHQSLLEIYKIAGNSVSFPSIEDTDNYSKYFLHTRNPYIENLFYEV